MREIVRQIIAAGDGLLNGKDPYMDLYILAQSKKKNPKICLLPTASGDNAGLIRYFYDLFKDYPCDPSHLSLFGPHTADIKDFIMSKDIIYVTGGQSKSMMAVWREWNVDVILREAYENGTILSGGSAGSVCWFDQCVTDSIPGSLTVMNCLGIIPFSNCPHFASQSRRSSYAKFISSKEIKEGYAADDFAALHFVNEQFLRGVSSRPYAKVFNLSIKNDKFNQKTLSTKWLGLSEYQQEFIFNSPTFEYEEESYESKSTSTDIIKFEQKDNSDSLTS